MVLRCTYCTTSEVGPQITKVLRGPHCQRPRREFGSGRIGRGRGCDTCDRVGVRLSGLLGLKVLCLGTVGRGTEPLTSLFSTVLST